MKTAKFYKKFKVIEFWVSKNTKEKKHCETLKRAKSILENSNVEQSLVIV